MGTIPTTYTYTDGNVLVPAGAAGHNANIFNLTASRGIMSEPNGGLDTANLVGGFSVRAEHIWPEEAHRARWDGVDEKADYLSDAFGESVDRVFVSIAHAAVRFNVPYTATCILYQWSVFASVWRYFGTLAPANPNGRNTVFTSNGPEIKIKAFLDGTALAHTERSMPNTVTWSDTDVRAMRENEARNALWLDMAHMAVTGDTGVAAGFHDIEVRVYMEASGTQSVYESVPIRRRIDGTRSVSDYRVHSRMTTGARNARALVLL